MAFQDTVKPDEPALITNLFSRRLAHPLALLARKLGMSANVVTLLGGMCWVLSTPLAVIAGFVCGRGSVGTGKWLWFVCGVLWNLGYILDLADGSLARMTHTSSDRGFYLDYVFHLLFKPAFLASIGIGTALCNETLCLPLLLLSILSIPANWSASASAAEHVLCEQMGKGKLRSSATEEEKRLLWLGGSDITESSEKKRATPLRMARTLAVEIFSYYGQFSFFSLLVLLDLFTSACGSICGITMPLTTFFFILITVLFLIRVPMRILRDYRRFGDR